MKVTNLNSNYDAAVQSQQIDDAIAQKFDIIVLVYVNDQAVVPALTRAKAAGIPVVLIVTPLKKDYEELFTSYVGTDHRELGRLAGEGMVKGLMAEGKTKAQIVAVTGAAQQLNVQDRIAAFKAVLAKHPGFELGRRGRRQVEHRPDREDHRRVAGALQRARRRRRHLRHGGQPGDRLDSGGRSRRASRLGVANKGIVVVGSNCMKDGVLHIKSGQQYRHRHADPDRGGRDRREEGRRAFQRREAEEIRAGAGPWHQQGERRAVRRRLLVLSTMRVQRYPACRWDNPFSLSKG